MYALLAVLLVGLWLLREIKRALFHISGQIGQLAPYLIKEENEEDWEDEIMSDIPPLAG